jgi:hypothetical protein
MELTSNIPLNIPHAELTFNPLPSHRFLNASRRCPAREVVDFREGPIPWPGSIEVSAMEERLDCWAWGWERDEAQIIWSAVGPFTPLATNPNSQTTYIYSLPATTPTLPLPASSGALEIAASPGVPTLASRTKHGDRDVRALVCVHPKGEPDQSRRD